MDFHNQFFLTKKVKNTLSARNYQQNGFPQSVFCTKKHIIRMQFSKTTLRGAKFSIFTQRFFRQRLAFFLLLIWMGFFAFHWKFQNGKFLSCWQICERRNSVGTFPEVSNIHLDSPRRYYSHTKISKAFYPQQIYQQGYQRYDFRETLLPRRPLKGQKF